MPVVSAFKDEISSILADFKPRPRDKDCLLCCYGFWNGLFFVVVVTDWFAVFFFECDDNC